jgi:membrane protein required for colicin V production
VNWADIAILAVIGLSVLVSLWRGFIREVLSIVAWVLAFWVAFVFTERAAGALAGAISVPSLRYIAAFLLLLILTLIVTGIANYLIARLVDTTGLSGTDRLLGIVFGLVRGVAIVAVLVILARATPVTEDPWWRGSVLLPHFDRLALWAISYFPDDIAAYFK